MSELVTNARKYVPGPCLLDLEISEGAVQISVWDSSTTLPSVQAADPERIGQHGLEIAMAVSQTFCIQREPVGKRITASVVLAVDPGGDPAGHQARSPNACCPHGATGPAPASSNARCPTGRSNGPGTAAGHHPHRTPRPSPGKAQPSTPAVLRYLAWSKGIAGSVVG
ncbi:ATP-binding protein [Streptomyces sviceus]